MRARVDTAKTTIPYSDDSSRDAIAAFERALDRVRESGDSRRAATPWIRLIPGALEDELASLGRAER